MSTNEITITQIPEMIGKTFTGVFATRQRDNIPDKLLFGTREGEYFEFFHEQVCCEDVRIEDIEGDLDDLKDSPILMAEIVSKPTFEREFEKRAEESCEYESYSWTFYKFATIKGTVVVRWFGSSNGCYSEAVSMSWTREHKRSFSKYQ